MCMATVQNCEAELPDVLSAIQSKGWYTPEHIDSPSADVEALAVAYEKVNQWTQDQFVCTKCLWLPTMLTSQSLVTLELSLKLCAMLQIH